jgi:hypothetical protein
MLTCPKVLFVLAVLLGLTLTAFAARRIVRTIGRGRASLNSISSDAGYGKPWPSSSPSLPRSRTALDEHLPCPGRVGPLYLLVNVVDVTEAFLPPICSWRERRCAMRSASSADIFSVGV